MKKFIRTLTAAALAAVMCASVAGCSAMIAEINGAADLVGKTIGVQLGTTGDILAQDIDDAEILQYNKGASAIMALTQGKVDAVIIDDQPAKVFVEKNEGLVILNEEFTIEEYAIAVKKGNTELKESINGALAELKADGTLTAIKDYWIDSATDSDVVKTSAYTTPEGTTYPNGQLVMATNAEFPPYESIAGDDIVGYDVDMMRAVCDKLGYELVIENIDFDSIIASVNSGKADVGVAGMSVTEDRLQNVDFTDTYISAKQVIIVKAESVTDSAATTKASAANDVSSAEAE